MTLSAWNLTVSRGRSVIVRDVSFSSSAGTLLVVAGRNGVGKTSLLRALSGDLRPNGGSVSFGGTPLSEWKTRDLARRRSFLFQQTECRLPFTSHEIAVLGAEAAGLGGKAARAAAAESLSVAGVSHLAARTISSLSGGEQQRVHWARILAQINRHAEGHLLFLDEPVSSLDIAHQHELLSRAQRLAAEGATVIAVLHDLNLAARYATGILLLHESSIAAIGTPETVLKPEILSKVFGVTTRVIRNPCDASPLVLVESEQLPASVEMHTDNARTARQTPC